MSCPRLTRRLRRVNLDPVRLRRHERPETDFPMAPMIDMVFLLLVFFLFAGTFARASKPREVELAQSDQSQVPEDTSARLTVTLEADGRIFLGDEAIELPALGKVLREAHAENPDLGLNLRANRETPYREVRAVLKRSSEAGISDVIYATHQLD